MYYHFIFGLDENFNGKPFQYFHYLTIKSCWLTQNNPEILIHCLYEPINNEWWDKIKEFAKVVKYEELPNIVYHINGKDVWRTEHKSDILRLLILEKYGGVYADIDTLFYKNFFPTFSNEEFVLGIEETYYEKDNISVVSGLCNALIICNKSSQFLSIWKNLYYTEYDDYDWNKMSVRIPYELSLKHPSLITVAPKECFHKYSWTIDIYNNEIIGGENDIYSKHYCESKNYEVLNSLTRDKIINSNSLFARMCKQIPTLL